MEDQPIDYTKESVLVVDDDPQLRAVLEELLRALRFETASAGSAMDAISMLEQTDYTFLLADMKMPGIDGLELVRRVKQSFPAVSIIAMTAFGDEYKYIDVINAGATDFIKKPINIAELEAKVRRTINERNLREELSRLSITDSLTGLYNQRHFYRRLEDEIRRCNRQNHELSLMLLDLDNFKAYNDKHGHLAGDEVLKSVGDLINRSIRQGMDSGYRYGGDEFAVILVGADLSIAADIGKRIQDALEQNGVVTASMGFVKYSQGMSIKEFVAHADRQLYTVKEAYKNESGK